MGESKIPRAARPLLFSPGKGRDAGALGSPNLRKQGLSLAGGRKSSSGERQRGSCEATEGAVKGSRLAMGPSHSPPWAPPCTVTAALFPPRLDAPVPPVISKKPRQQEAASHIYMRSPRYPAGDDPTADPSAALRRRPAPPRPAPPRPAMPPSAFHANGPKAGRGSDEAANPGRVLTLVYLVRS